MSARPTTRDEDHEIIRQIGRGDHDAFRCLVDRYRGPLYGFILRMVKRPAIAEELAQETFVRAYRAAPRYEPTASVSTWLFQIAARLAMNEAAKAHHAREIMIDGPDIASNSAGPDTALESLEIGRAIEAALDQLPPNSARRSCWPGTRRCPTARSGMCSTSARVRWTGCSSGRGAG